MAGERELMHKCMWVSYSFMLVNRCWARHKIMHCGQQTRWDFQGPP